MKKLKVILTIGVILCVLMWSPTGGHVHKSKVAPQPDTIPAVQVPEETLEESKEVLPGKPGTSTKKTKYHVVRTTYYNPVESQTDSDPLVTADMSRISLESLREGSIKWIAISRDLLPEYPFGTKVMVTSRKYPEITGIYEVHDVMGPRFKYSIDLLLHPGAGKEERFGPHLCEIRKIQA